MTSNGIQCQYKTNKQEEKRKKLMLNLSKLAKLNYIFHFQQLDNDHQQQGNCINSLFIIPKFSLPLLSVSSKMMKTHCRLVSKNN